MTVCKISLRFAKINFFRRKFKGILSELRGIFIFFCSSPTFSMAIRYQKIAGNPAIWQKFENNYSPKSAKKLTTFCSYGAPTIDRTPTTFWLSSTAGMSIPYTFGWRTGGAADAKYTLLAPTSRAISMICSLVVPRTIESSTRSTFFPSNSRGMAFSFLLTDFIRISWPGIMNVRPT